MVPMIVRVYDDLERHTPGTEVPLTPDTTCLDLIECCRDPGDEDCELVGIWAGKSECPLRHNDRPLEILQKWGGTSREPIKLMLRYTPVQDVIAGERTNLRNGMKEPGHFEETLPDGVQLTLSELRDMAYRQQHQIESQHQLLATKEQRLRYLKEQEARHQRVATENERLRRLRDRVEAQEMKLRKLRALRGQVDQNKQNNALLTSDLDSIRALFNEKEKELSVAVAKVDELTRQLEDLRRGRASEPPSAAALELEKLRRELMYRNKLNEQQNARLHQQREALTQRQEEMTNIDKRISELQDRLHRKRILNQQLANQITVKPSQIPNQLAPVNNNHGIINCHQINNNNNNNNINNNAMLKKQQSRSNNNNIAAIEPYNHIPSTNTNNDFQDKLQKNYFIPVISNQLKNVNINKDEYNDIMNNVKKNNTNQQEQQQNEQNDFNNISDFIASKSDPKYQTLPYNTKFSVNLLQLSSTNKNNTNQVVPSNNINSNDKDTVDKAQMSVDVGVEPINNVKTNSSNSGGFQQHMTVHSTPLSTINKSLAVPVINQQNDDKNTKLSSTRGQPVGGPSSNTVQNAPKPSQTIYQTSSTKIQPVQPQQQQQPDTPTIDKSPKPILPPKPAIKPPPRQTQFSLLDEIKNKDQPPPPPPPLSEPPQDTSPPIKPNYDNKPIKAKPLTIKKQPAGAGEQPPRLRNTPKLNGGVHVTINRRIEMPPAFLFPETETPPSDLVQTDKKETDSSKSTTNDEEESNVVRRTSKGNLKQNGKVNLSRRVSFDPLALLLDASLEGELELVKKTAAQVPNPSAANDEGITALHNAICAGHLEIVQFLVEFGCDVNAQDSDGWTPLHCAASCNNVAMVRFLVEHGACIFATTLSDHETAAEKCEEDEEGFDGCSEYLYSVQEKLGILCGGAVYAVFDYQAQQTDELSFSAGDQLTVIRKGDENEREWWWARLGDREGYIPRNLLGLYPRVTPKLTSD